jgi:uncharacterized protein (DUF983 family)
MKLRTILLRACRLRCPACGECKLFRGWFRLRPRCEACDLPFEREGGFYLGSIYVNYGLTAILVTIGYFALYFSEVVSPDAALWICLAFCLLFPLWFFRYARSLWLALDCYLDPEAATKGVATKGDGSAL